MTTGRPRRVGRPSNREIKELEGRHGRVLQAIAYVTRRRILLLLEDHPQAVHAIARNFDISRPMVSKHLRVLREAGLVECTGRGRERIYRVAAGDAPRLAIALAHADEHHGAVLDAVRERLADEEGEP